MGVGRYVTGCTPLTARNGFSGQTKATRPQRSGCSPRPRPPFARVGPVRASVSVLVRVPYSPPRRSGRGGTPRLRIFSHQGRGLHFPDQPSARLLPPGARLRGLWAWGRLNLTFQFPALIKKKKKKKAKRRPSLPAHGPSQTHHHRCLLWRNRLKPPPLPRGPPTRAWSQAMSAHVAAGGGDLRPSLRARASGSSGKQIAPHDLKILNILFQ